MIKNQKQFGITKDRLTELNNAKTELENNKGNFSSLEYEIGLDGLDGLIEELEHQIKVYESLVSGDFHCFEVKSLENLPDILIAARLAQKISQKELGERLSIQEQQIQRYESTDYESASYYRLLEIANALGLKLYLEKVIIINSKPSFDTPSDTSLDEICKFESMVKNNGSLLIQ